MLGFLMISLLVFAPPDRPAVSAEDFAKQVKAKIAPLKDVAFIYKGEKRWVGPSDMGIIRHLFGSEYRGGYLYRNDGAALLDVTQKDLSTKPRPVQIKHA